MFPHDLKQTPAFISVLLTRRAKKYKNKTDGKIESVYVNRQLSVFPCWSRKWTQTWSTGIPVSPSSPTCPLLWGPHHDGRSPGRELHCVCDVNFLFYRGSWVCLYGSVRILLWETMTRKWYFSWFFFSFFWEAVIIVSGKQNSLSKTFKFTFKSAPAQSESNLTKNSSLLFQATETRWTLQNSNVLFYFTNKMKATLVRWPQSLELNLNPSHEGIWMWSVWATGPPVVSWPSAGFVPFTCLLSTLDDRSPKKLLWKSALLHRAYLN